MPYAANMETCVTDNEHIVTQACERPFVKYCVVVESGLICVSLSPRCGRVSLSEKGGTDTQNEEVKSICPLTGGSFTPYQKVLSSVAETDVKEASVRVIH